MRGGLGWISNLAVRSCGPRTKQCTFGLHIKHINTDHGLLIRLSHRAGITIGIDDDIIETGETPLESLYGESGDSQ